MVYMLYIQPKRYLYNITVCIKMIIIQWKELEVPVEMDTAKRVQILAETECISHSTNTLGKGMNPIILPTAMGK